MSSTNIAALLGVAALLIAGTAMADLGSSNGTSVPAELITIRENLHPGQKVQYVWTDHYTLKSTATANDPLMPKDSDTGHSWKVTLTIQEVKDGSAIRSVADVDPQSFDTSKDDAANETKTPTAYAGKSIGLMRHPDDSLTNDFQGNASSDDVDLINNFVTPDAEWYPDNSVAVGDTWDDSTKVGKYASLGPNDTITSKGRLDWVKWVDGKQIAQISHSVAIIYHEDNNVEEDYTFTGTQLVDLASGVTIRVDQKGSSKFIMPGTVPLRVLGRSEFMDHCEVVPDASAGATTQP
jgi:hypothetical protein